MDVLTNELRSLDTNKLVESPERLIMTKLSKITTESVENHPESAIIDLLAQILKLFALNKGKISIQCSLFVGSKLLVLYRCCKVPPIWDLFSMTVENSLPCLIYASGYICRHLDKGIKSQIPRLFKHLISLKESLLNPALYALRGIVKAQKGSDEDTMVKTIDYARKAISSGKTLIISSSLQLLRTCLRYAHDHRPVLDCLKHIMIENQIPSIKNEASLLIARSAAMQVSMEHQENSEWSLNNNKKGDFEAAERVLLMYPGVLHISVPIFIDLLSFDTVFAIQTDLFAFLLDRCPSSINAFASLIPEESKKIFFKQTQGSLSLSIMKSLSSDAEDVNETSMLAFQMVLADDKEKRREALDYFSELARENEDLAFSVFRQAILFIPETTVYEEAMRYAVLARTIFTNLKCASGRIQKEIDFFRPHLSKIGKLTGHQTAFLYQISDITEIFDNEISILVSISLATLSKSKLASIPDRYLFKTCLSQALRTGVEGALKSILAISGLYTAKLSLGTWSMIAQLAAKEKYPLPKEIFYRIVEILNNSPLTNELIKDILTFSLPTGLEVTGFHQNTGYNSESLKSLIQSMPDIIESLPSDIARQYQGELVQTANPINLIILSQVLRSNSTLNINVQSLFKMLLGLLKSKDLIIIQLGAECARRLLMVEPSYIASFIDHLKVSNSVAAVIYAGHLASISTSPSQILEIVTFLTIQIKNSQNIPFCLFSLNCLIMSNFNYVESLSLVNSQMEVVFDVVNTAYSLQPICLHLITKLFCTMIESAQITLSPTLESLTKLTLESIKLTPSTYHKESYLTAANAVCTFATSLLEPVCLSKVFMCETLVTLFQFGKLKFDISILPKLIMQLHKTGDKHLSELIIRLSEISGEKNTLLWMTHIRRILLSGNLIDSSSYIILPSLSVVSTFLKVSKTLVDSLKSLEYLDDIVAAATLACKNGAKSDAFSLLKKIIQKYRTELNEDGRYILELYESQFDEALHYAFDTDLSSSGGFVRAYLEYWSHHFDNSETGLLVTCINSIQYLHDGSTDFYRLLLYIISLLRRFPDLISVDYLKSLMPLLEDQAIQGLMLSCQEVNWKALSEFRQTAGSYFRDLLTNYVWIKKVIGDTFDYEGMLGFLLYQLNGQKEQFLREAFAHTIETLLSLFVDCLPSPLLLLALSVMSQEHDSEINLACARHISRNVNVKLPLLSYLVHKQFDTFILAHILSHDEENEMKAFVPCITQMIFEECQKGSLAIEEATALFSVMRKHFTGVSLEVVNLTMNLDPSFAELKFGVLKLFLDMSSLSDKVIRFCIERFTSGGLDLIVYLILNRRDVGLSLFMRGCAKAAVILTQADVENSVTYIKFLHLGLKLMPFNPDFLKTLFLLSSKLLDTPICRKAVIEVLREVQDIDKVENTLKIMSFDEKEKFFLSLKKAVDSESRSHMILGLPAFSQNARTRRSSSEWETLEVDD